MPQPSSPSSHSFPVTRWTLVHRMTDDRKLVRLQGWQEFFDIYWRALVEWLERQGLSSPDAQDLVQGFIQKLWKSEHFASSLNPEGGKLRSFLFKSLRNWHLDQLAYEKRLKRGGGQEHLEYNEADGSAVVPDKHYDQAWARATLTHVCKGLRAEYEDRKNVQLFDQGLTLLDEREPQRFELVCQQLEMKKNTLNVALKRLRERLSSRIRQEVEATLTEPTPSQVNEEILHLLAAFGERGSFAEIISSLSPDS